MIRIDEIYNNTFWPWLRINRPGVRMYVCDPFGRSDPDSIICYGREDLHEHNYIFFFDQEPIHLNIHTATFDRLAEETKDLVYFWGIPEESTPTTTMTNYVVTSERDSDSVKMLCDKYPNLVPLYYFFHGWAALDWYRGYDKTFLIKPVAQRTPTRTFIAPNRIIAGERQHRLEMLYWIFKLEMTNNHISCPETCPAENISIHQAIKPLTAKYPDIEEVFAKQSLPINFAGETDHPMHSCWLSLFDEAADSMLYLVTETVATGRRHHLTEKTFKPIAMGMPFMIVGTQGSLAYLRSYGFKTFGDFWDESYDDIADDNERIAAVARTLKQLEDLGPELRNAIFHCASDIVQHNWDHFYNGSFEEVLWTELQDMLHQVDSCRQLNFVADKLSRGQIYPALANWEATARTQKWREFDQHWPYTVPIRLQEYCEAHGVKINIYKIDNFPDNCYYPIGLSFFDFDIDYFDLLPPEVFSALCSGALKILFYYHEGDNPWRIKERLDALVDLHKLNHNCYIFVSANTAAQNIPGFVYFPDHESWFYCRNFELTRMPINSNRRSRDFTVLVRLHKSWRAVAMSDLHRLGILDNSTWSYCETGNLDISDCPIEIDSIPGLREHFEQFVSQTPCFCDNLTQDQRNDHHHTVPELFVDSYCNIVFETHFDVDQSQGAFLTEKTFKPIKYGQMFFIAGGPGSLQILRDLGYRVFDHVLDNSYDLEPDNTKRWTKLVHAIQKAQSNLHDVFLQCQDDIKHNQRLFMSSKAGRLNKLIRDINDQQS